jgi:hypothetical protein
MLATESRFRVQLGKSSIPFGSDGVLAFSTSPSSYTLLEWVSKQLKNPASKFRQMKFKSVIVCHVDLSCIIPDSQPNPSLQAFVESKGLEFVSIPIESLFEDSIFLKHALESTCASLEPFQQQDSLPVDQFTSKEKCIQFFKALGTQSSRQDALQSLILNVLIRFTQKIGYNSILCADTCTRMAIKAIAETSKGRGRHVPFQVASESSLNNITFLRPLKDITHHEIKLYNELADISCETLPKMFSEEQPSIDSLTRGEYYFHAKIFTF